MGEFATAAASAAKSPQGQSLIQGSQASFGLASDAIGVWSGIMKSKAQRAIVDANASIRESQLDIENAGKSEVASERQRKRLKALEETNAELYAQSILSGVGVVGSVNAAIQSASTEASIDDYYDNRNAEVEIGQNEIRRLTGRVDDIGKLAGIKSTLEHLAGADWKGMLGKGKDAEMNFRHFMHRRRIKKEFGDADYT